MSVYQFSKDQARTMLLRSQGFGRPGAVNSRATVESCIQQMGVLQIDTIHVIARSPYLVLWSRLGEFDPSLLEELHAAGRLFEYWSHEACFIPIEHYPLYRRMMIEARKHKGRFQWLQENQVAATAMLEHVTSKGPTRSSDFDRTDGVKGNWWNWKAEKIALDYLHTSGELMIARREKFHRIYDLRERVLPNWSDREAPDYETAVSQMVLMSVGCLGVAKAEWCADYFRLPNRDVLLHLKKLEASGTITAAKIEGLDGDAYFASHHLDLANRVISGEETFAHSTLLSPFDPIVWDRKRALQLFDFDYRIECYVPAPKRKFGYFVLPILVGNRIVGRLDAKAHRVERIFEVKSLHLEKGIEEEDALLDSIAQSIKNCALWHRTPKVVISQADRPRLARQVQKLANR
jgi:uncharacterized protein YcaQ